MAEETAAKEQTPDANANATSKKNSILIMVLLVVNVLSIVGVGVFLYLDKKKKEKNPTIENVVQGEFETQQKENKEEKPLIGKIIPIDTFVVNLAGSKGRRIAKVNMELEIEGEKIQEEIEVRKAQIRDIIIIQLSAKSYDEISTREGKEKLREEIKDTVNGFLKRGKILNVYFTDFIYN